MMLSKSKFVKAVDLSHRIEPCSLYDNLLPAILRAEAIADVLESVCLSGDLDGLRPETLRYAAQAIRFELQDAQSMLEAWQNTPAEDLMLDGWQNTPETEHQGDDNDGGEHE